MKAIITEFRVIKSLANKDKEFVARVDMPETPLKGEVVNIEGSPYIVYRRGWALSGDSTVQYCYIDLIQA